MKGCCECNGDKLFSKSLVNNLQNGLKLHWDIQKKKKKGKQKRLNQTQKSQMHTKNCLKSTKQEKA